MSAIADHQLLLLPPVRPLGDRFEADFFRSIPEQPGVYLLSAAREGVLYVGKARNLRRRLGSYRSGSSDRLPRKIVRLLRRVERIDWDVCSDEAAALARERELIRTLQPRFNTQGVRPPRQWFIGCRRHEDFLILTLEDAADPASDCNQWWGPFTFAQLTFAALLRSLWRELHPRARVADLPSRLLPTTSFVLREWRAPWNERVAAWLSELDRFLTGQPSRLVGSRGTLINRIFDGGRTHHHAFMATGPSASSLHRTAAPASPLCPVRLFGWPGSRERLERLGMIPARALSFDEQCHAQDAECLADFHARFGEKNHALARSLDAANRPALSSSRPRIDPKVEALTLTGA